MPLAYIASDTINRLYFVFVLATVTVASLTT